MRSNLESFLGFVVIVALCFSALPVDAHNFTIDQQVEPPITLFRAVYTGSMTGQEFVPQQSSLDVVELYLDADSKACERFSIVVRIREATITGTVLGTSNALSWGCEYEIAHFDFPSPVALVPGNTYVIEPVADDLNHFMIMPLGGVDQYASGSAIYDGVVDATIDLWFREGSSNPLPTRSTTWGAVKALYR